MHTALKHVNNICAYAVREMLNCSTDIAKSAVSGCADTRQLITGLCFVCLLLLLFTTLSLSHHHLIVMKPSKDVSPQDSYLQAWPERRPVCISPHQAHRCCKVVIPEVLPHIHPIASLIELPYTTDTAYGISCTKAIWTVKGQSLTLFRCPLITGNKALHSGMLQVEIVRTRCNIPSLTTRMSMSAPKVWAPKCEAATSMLPVPTNGSYTR